MGSASSQPIQAWTPTAVRICSFQQLFSVELIDVASDYATHDAKFEITERTWSTGESLLLLFRGWLVRLSLCLAKGYATLWLQQ